MTALIVDASVVIKWFVDESERELALALADSGVELRAPRLVIAEVANGLWKNVRRGAIDEETALDAIALVPRYFVELFDTADLIKDALSQAVRLQHPVYDLLYIEGARRRGVQMITADARLMRALRDTPHQNSVVALSDWRA